MFNRLAEEWRRQNRDALNEARAEALIGIVQRNLCRVDTSETACRITAFSLYLAVLDKLKPRDIQELQRRGRFLPRLVLGKNQEPEFAGHRPCFHHT